ncbi:glutamyl-tRNA reductase [Clostridium lacusfryxellense]|uniref:glutamyl-tRNA reductase n=1 Tax=Clostridium lacusfryxellense TaxID=205328 RepID=UPI001C0DA519|nr:glutamyl-tRNA reductase [Clostridium lacusfryxellense]MBU3110913.1 glutamyl-tRNA reductase [Clostridium lacusfryxellense]
MIQLIGLKHDVKLEIREKLSIIPIRQKRCLEALLEICEEAVILSTCNRTEIYFKSKDEDIVSKIFKALSWDENLIKCVIRYKDEKAVRHLMEVVCGFDSLLLGEDQILGQVRDAYEIAKEIKTNKKELQRLFESSISCGKHFRTKSKISEIPVSSSSMVVKKAIDKGHKRFMVLGYGSVGELTSKYILESKIDRLYIVVRDTQKVNIEDDRAKIIPFYDLDKYYNRVDCIISCTTAPHTVVHLNELPNKRLLLFDLAVPRDIEEIISENHLYEVYDIDMICDIHDANYKRRQELMIKNRYIVDKAIKEYIEWKTVEELAPFIKKIKSNGDDVYKERLETFKHKKKTKDNEKLAELLLKSTSNAYVNRAIDVLKEEHLKGRSQECQDIISRIFQI